MKSLYEVLFLYFTLPPKLSSSFEFSAVPKPNQICTFCHFLFWQFCFNLLLSLCVSVHISLLHTHSFYLSLFFSPPLTLSLSLPISLSLPPSLSLSLSFSFSLSSISLTQRKGLPCRGVKSELVWHCNFISIFFFISFYRNYFDLEGKNL